MWFTLTLFLLTPVTFLGPVMMTKLLSITSTMTHLLPVSRPANFTHILPTSTAGTLVQTPLKRINREPPAHI